MFPGTFNLEYLGHIGFLCNLPLSVTLNWTDGAKRTRILGVCGTKNCIALNRPTQPTIFLWQRCKWTTSTSVQTSYQKQFFFPNKPCNPVIVFRIKRIIKTVTTACVFNYFPLLVSHLWTSKQHEGSWQGDVGEGNFIFRATKIHYIFFHPNLKLNTSSETQKFSITLIALAIYQKFPNTGITNMAGRGHQA